MSSLPNKLFVIFLICGLMLGIATTALAEASLTDSPKVTFHEFLQAIDKNSLDLASQRETINGAEAGVSIAGVRPDPVVTAGIAGKELSHANKPNTSTASTIGLAYTIETGGKREARIRAAQSNVKVVSANLRDFTTQLYSDAAAGFVETCRTQQVLSRKQLSLKAAQEITDANQTRFHVGAIGKLELLQSQVEADKFSNEITSAEADAIAASSNLSTLIGKRFEEVFGNRPLECSLQLQPLPSSLNELIEQASVNRRDILLAKAALENNQDALELAKANRWVDPTVNVEVTHTPSVATTYDTNGNATNSPTTVANSNMLSLTVSVPIPLSRLQKGEVIQASSALTQAQLQLQSTQLKAETEVKATYAQYQAALKNVDNYANKVVPEADRIFDGVRFSYTRGAASLLDVLNARRVADDIYLGYLQALADLANSKINLELSVGLLPSI